MRLLRKNAFSRICCNQDGSTIIEYAIVVPVFFMLFFGITEFGLFMYHKIAVERIAVDVSRAASIGKTRDDSGPCSATIDQLDYMNCLIIEKSKGLINGNRISMQINTLAAGGTTVPDICLDDEANPTSAPATCATWQEVNGINLYQGAAASSAGGRGEVMEVLITYPWSVQFPLLNQFFGTDEHKGVVMVRAATIIKNEPN